MTCDTLRDAIVDVARRVTVGTGTAAAVETHVAHCASCAALLARETALSEGLQRLAAGGEDAPVPEPSPEIEGRLMAAFAAQHGPRRATASGMWVWGVRAAAAAVLVAGGAIAWRTVQAPGARTNAPAVAVERPNVEQFMALPVAIGLPDFESGDIVRVELPLTALPNYGIDITPDAGQTAVQADLLVGQDGQPRAIRLVRSTDERAPTP